MQVIGSIGEDVDGGPALKGEVVEGVDPDASSPAECTDGGVQIVVFGGNDLENVFLINAPDKQIGETRIR